VRCEFCGRLEQASKHRGFSEIYVAGGLVEVILRGRIDAEVLARAERGCYARSSLADLPAGVLARAFIPAEQEFCVKPQYRAGKAFLQQDVRQDAPAGLFHLVLCRNVAFTYFDDAVQRDVLRRIADHSMRGGALVLGSTESLPSGDTGFATWSGKLRVYRRKED
jgi:chemotaxis protein methyltransferase CheR